MADLLENLNEKQRKAVLETEGYVRVIAGAGSGKTKLLVSRYAYLVQDYGIDSSNILCVTFTNKAAGEMKKRIRALIGDTHDTSLICTYHGFCNRLLRENPEKLFLDKQFQILDDRQQKAILGEIYQKFELKLDYASFESMLHKIGAVKKDMAYVIRLCDPKPCQILSEIKNQDDEIIEEFLQRQKATYSLDFHDLISFAIHLLETDSQVREKWQNRLNYIMVDEFQDSSGIEMRLVELLSGMFQNLMIVGDPDQNIYEWRGSNVKLLVDFDKGHEPTKTIMLEQNYRSTPQILTCANHLIEKNELRLKKNLFTKNAAGVPVVHYHSRDEFEEMDRVIENIRRLREEEGLNYSDFAVIYRSSSLSRVAEKKLVEKNIPYEIFGGVRFYQRMEILDILAYLKLIAFDDDVSFRRIINKPRRHFGRAKMNRLEELQKQDSRNDEKAADRAALPSLFAALSAHLDEREFVNSDAAAFVRFVETMREESKTKRISDLVNEVTKDSGYESYIRELGDEERLSNLAEFKRLSNEFEREFGENLSLVQFLQQIALQSGEDAKEEKDKVKLMTIHASKGLEFLAVFILGFTEGIFPSAKTIGERKKPGLEEERRLCYVAITRAQKYLFLMDSEGLTQNGIKKLVSRFLEEIGEENYVRIGKISEELKKESRSYAAKLIKEIGEKDNNVRKAGDVVEHHIFGRGTIEEIDEKHKSYLILFERLKQVRNISYSYFEKEHEDVRKKNYNGAETEAVPARVEEAKENSAVRNDAVKIAALQPDESRWKFAETDAFDWGKLEESAAEIESALMQKTKENMQEDMQEGMREQIPESAVIQSVIKDAAADIGADQTEDLNSSVSASPAKKQSGLTDAQAARLKELKENTPNLWKHDEVPHTGWTCTGISDLGGPVGICEMCGIQIIRYAHHMEHPRCKKLSVGCVCAGRMEGDAAGAKQREAEFKNKQARRVNFFKRQWKQSKKGNEYLKIDGHVIVLYHNTNNGNIWKYSIDNEFCRNAYVTRDRAVAGAFEALEQRKA